MKNYWLKKEKLNFMLDPEWDNSVIARVNDNELYCIFCLENKKYNILHSINGKVETLVQNIPFFEIALNTANQHYNKRCDLIAPICCFKFYIGRFPNMSCQGCVSNYYIQNDHGKYIMIYSKKHRMTKTKCDSIYDVIDFIREYERL